VDVVSGSPQTAVCLRARGAGESLEERTAGRLLNLKGEDSTGERRDCTIGMLEETF